MALCMKLHVNIHRIPIDQRLQPLASIKLEILSPGPPSKLETYKIMKNVRIMSAKSIAAGV